MLTMEMLHAKVLQVFLQCSPAHNNVLPILINWGLWDLVINQITAQLKIQPDAGNLVLPEWGIMSVPYVMIMIQIWDSHATVAAPML